MRTRTFLTTATAAIVLTACSSTGGSGPTDGASEGPSQVSGPVRSAPTAQATTGNGRPDTRRTSDRSGPYDLVPEHLRVEERPGGDRVVLTFRGRGTAGWTAMYVEDAVLDGSGRAVDLDGDTLLSVTVSGTPTRPSDRLARVRTAVAGGVTDAFVGAAWEGVTQVFLGLEGGRTPYRITTLSSPSRLVVHLGPR